MLQDHHHAGAVDNGWPMHVIVVVSLIQITDYQVAIVVGRLLGEMVHGRGVQV